MDTTSIWVDSSPEVSSPAVEAESAIRGSMLLKVSEVAHELRIARSYAYRLVQDGDLPVVRIGRAVRVPRVALEQYIEQHTEGGNAPKV